MTLEIVASNSSPESVDPLFLRLKRVLLSLEVPGLEDHAIAIDSLLVDDIGLDSLRFVDLTVALEEELCIEQFPMQDWVDALIEAGKELTVRELLRKCRELVPQAKQGGAHV
jgi:acyl carrier protein